MYPEGCCFTFDILPYALRFQKLASIVVFVFFPMKKKTTLVFCVFQNVRVAIPDNIANTFGSLQMQINKYALCMQHPSSLSINRKNKSVVVIRSHENKRG